jgi:uncharacterized surface protein with fasciclin (FAS1) repeats
MNSSDRTRLILIVLAVVIIGFGLWWLMGQQSPLGALGTSPTATSTVGSVTIQSSTGKVGNVVADLEVAGRFTQLLNQTGVMSQIAGKGPYTIFVPTDGAFGRLVPGTVNSLSSTELKRLVQYHVVSGKRLDLDALQSGQVQAVSGDVLNINVDSQKRVYVNSGNVIAAYNTQNGIVYVINSVLVPPKQ